MVQGGATRDGTARFRARFPAQDAAGFCRSAQNWSVSTLGLGTYLGGVDDAADSAYENAIATALAGGINFLDTAINYRHQRSERAIGRVIARFSREEIIVSTKAGFLVPGAIPPFLKEGDIAGGMHAMTPEFLADQIERSRANLGVETVDVFYLHNPETQLGFVAPAEFDARIRAAFEMLERLACEGRIQYYGTATWGGYRTANALSLARMVELAREAGGEGHRFRFVQLPFNLAMTEALTARTQMVKGANFSALEAASRLGLTVVASASLMQARLARGLPEALAAVFPEAKTDAVRALQFARSAPGVTVALAGMSNADHVKENLGIASFPPLEPAVFEKIFAPPAR